MKHNIFKIALCGLLAAAPVAVATASTISVEAVQADNVTIKGQVVDESGAPVSGVGVVVAGTTIGTTADLDGYFSLEVPADATVQFISVGMETLEVAVNGRADLGTIVMKVETMRLSVS